MNSIGWGLLAVAIACALGLLIAYIRARQRLAVCSTRLEDSAVQHESRARTVEQLEAERTRLITDLERALGDARHGGIALEQLRGEAASLRDVRDTQVDRLATQGAELSGLRAEKEASRQRESQLNADHLASRQQAERQFQEIMQLREANAGLTREQQGLQKRLADQQQWVTEQTQLLQERAAAAAQQILEDKTRKFTETNKRELDALVGPFKEQLSEFRKRVDDIYAHDSRDRTELRERIQSLTELNQTVGRQALELTQALTLSAKSTGDWGELILQRILEESGLKKGREYELQMTITGLEGDDMRPDAIIFMPENRHLIVDSKVSNRAWTDYCAATDDDSRGVHLRAHLLALRNHVKSLAVKDYSRSPELQAVDFVLMFVPVEGALLTALSHDQTLYMDAFKGKVILVTPTTLLAVVKLVESLWRVEQRKQSADEIAEAGRKLYEKLTHFCATYLEIGECLEKATRQFEKAKGQLVDGRGNAISLAQRMTELGVQPGAGKTLPKTLLDQAEANDSAGIATVQEITSLPG